MLDHLYCVFLWRDLLFLEIEEKRAERGSAYNSWGLEDELCDKNTEYLEITLKTLMLQ